MNIDQIFNNSEKDFKIIRSLIPEFIERIPNLHSKYWKIYLVECKEYRDLSNSLNVLKKELLEYYRGRGSDEVIQRKSGNFQLKIEAGSTKKIARDDIDLYISTDDEYIDLKNKLDSQEKKLEYIKSLLDRIKSLNWELKNIIEFTRMEMGG